MNKLYIQYFKNNDKARANELDYCTKKNINNQNFDKIYVLLEKDEDDFEWLHNERTEVININKRVSYRDVFELSNSNHYKGDIHTLCNLDIFFDQSILEVFKNIKEDESYALTRWDINLKTKQSKLFNVNCSQDTWIWASELDLDKIDGSYLLGTGGCDNAICGEFHENGFKVLNPSHIVKTHHLHTGHARHYNDKLTKNLYFLTPVNNFTDTTIKFWKKGC